MSMTDRKPTAAFWITVALVAVVAGYPLSTGPFAWLCDHGFLSDASAALVGRSFYGPITWLHEHGPQPFQDSINWYVSLWQ
jgi:hypothetical protein